MADQKQKIWNFIGQLKENNNRVVSGVKTSISGTSDTNPQFNANIDGSGILNLSLSIPGIKIEGESSIGGVGKQYQINSSSTDPVGNKYGEIFNDYINNQADGIWTHVTGFHNKATAGYQTVFGKYNQNLPDDVLEVGWGESDTARSNLLRLDKNGNLIIKGDFKIDGGISLTELNENKMDKTSIDQMIKAAMPVMTEDHNANGDITIGTNETTIINNLSYASYEPENKALFWGDVVFSLTAPAKVTYRYYTDGNINQEYTTVEYYDIGEHFSTLFKIFYVGEEEYGIVSVTMTLEKADENQINIPTGVIKRNNVRGLMYVQGIKETAAWTGKIRVSDHFGLYPMRDVNSLPFTDKAEVTTRVPIPVEINESFGLTPMNTRRMGVVGFTAEPIMNEVIKGYIYWTGYKDLDDGYIYNRKYVDDYFDNDTTFNFIPNEKPDYEKNNNFGVGKDEKYKLKTNYDDIYGSELKVDSGRYAEVTIDKSYYLTVKTINSVLGNIPPDPFIDPNYPLMHHLTLIFGTIDKNKDNYIYSSDKYIYKEKPVFRLITNYDTNKSPMRSSEYGYYTDLNLPSFDVFAHKETIQINNEEYIPLDPTGAIEVLSYLNSEKISCRKNYIDFTENIKLKTVYEYSQDKYEELDEGGYSELKLIESSKLVKIKKITNEVK